jgi:hypothetical protein
MGSHKYAKGFAISLTLMAGLAGCTGTSENNPSTINDSTTRIVPEPGINPEAETNDSDLNVDLVSEQEVDFRITGGCYKSYEELGYYGIFEEFDDDCYLIVEVFPPEPSRYAELQFFDETWTVESSGETDAGGVLYLKVDPICDDGLWCDGIWEYRVVVESQGALQAERSPVFELDFIPWE